jgi:hypothetical protein
LGLCASLGRAWQQAPPACLEQAEKIRARSEVSGSSALPRHKPVTVRVEELR